MARKKKERMQRHEIDLGTLVHWIDEADDATVGAREVSERCRDYYDSKQISAAEERALKARKQAPVVINRIKPKIDGLGGMERANRTTAKAYPRTPKHEKSADAATEAIRFVLADEFWNHKRSTAWEFMTVEGTGMIEVLASDAGDKTKIRINAIPWDRIIHDPFSRRKDFSDARFLGQVVWMDFDMALDKYQDRADALEAMMSGSQTFEDRPKWVDSVRKRVKIVDLWWRESKTIKYATFTRGDYLVDPRESPYVDEEGNPEWPYEGATLFVDRDGQRYGAVLPYLDVQDEINKRRSKALHLMSVRQVKVFKGAIDDLNKVRNELARPDGVVEVNTSEPNDFEILKTGDMAAAQFNLLQEAKNEIDAVGYNAAASGKETRLMSGIALKNRELASRTEIAPMFDALRHLDIRVYRKIWNRIKQYWREEMWLRVTDDETSLRWVGLNAPMTKAEQVLREAKDKGAPPQALQQLMQQAQADPSMQEMVTTNDVAELDVDIVIDDAPDSPTMQIEQFQVLGEIIKSGAPPPLIKAMIQASPMPHKDQMIEELTAGPTVPPEVQEQMHKMKEEFVALKEENQKLKSDQQVDAAKLQQKGHEAQAELQLKSRIQEQEIALARAKAEAEIALKKMQLEADLQLEGAKLTLDTQRAEHEAGMKERQLAFDVQCRQADDAAKREEQVKTDEATAMPNFMKALEGITEAFVKAIQNQQQQTAQNQQFLAQLVEALKAPREVTIGGIRRDAEGRLAGASASQTIQ